MPATPITFPVDGFDLEGILDQGRSSDAAIICHPHPLYGGSMENNVVAAMYQAFREYGAGTLRFNFRGVGRSGGSYGDGEGEVRDVNAAAEFLRRQGASSIHLAGYSFGAWIALKAVQQEFSHDSLVLVSPPIDFLDFSGIELPSVPCLITLGERDAYCRVKSLEKWLSEQPAGSEKRELKTMADCDHFYVGDEANLADVISQFLKKNLPARGSGRTGI